MYPVKDQNSKIEEKLMGKFKLMGCVDCGNLYQSMHYSDK